MQFAIGALCFFAVVATFAQAELTPEKMEKLIKAAEKCKPTTGATDEDIETLKNHKFPETRTGHCFMACMKKEFGMMTADNKVDVAKMKVLAEPLKAKDAALYEKGMKIVETCAPEANAETDECDVAKKLMECAKREAAAIGVDLKDFMGH